MLSIEMGSERVSACECCGGSTITLTRYVYLNDSAFAVYFASFSEDHPDRPVKMAVGIGEWGEGSRRESRTAFALLLRASPAYEVMVTDASESPWRGASILGHMLDRSEALQHARIRDAFRIVDQVVIEDAPIRRFLAKQKQTTSH